MGIAALPAVARDAAGKSVTHVRELCVTDVGGLDVFPRKTVGTRDKNIDTQGRLCYR